MWFLTAEIETKETFGVGAFLLSSKRNQMQFSYISTECIYVQFFIVSKNLQRVFMLKRLNIDFFQKTCFPLSNWKFKEQTFLTTDTIAAVKQEAHREFYSETKWSFLVLLITINLTPSYFKTSSKGRAYLGKKSGQGWILNIFCAEHVNTLVAHLNTKGRHLHSPELPQYRDN